MTRIHRPSPATLIAFLALFVALGGPSQAAQLAKKVTGHHKSLRGPRGPRGPAGFAKAPIVRTGPFMTFGGVGEASGIALCNANEVVISGGVTSGDPIIGSAPYGTSSATGIRGWRAVAKSVSGGTPSGLVFVLCVPRP